MRERCSFDYAVVRIVPRVEREEFLNAGVILYCRRRDYLAARIRLNDRLLAALAPELDPATVQAHLDLIPRICTGGKQAGALGGLSQAERFRWLTSPQSTIVQTSPVHPGLCDDPEVALEETVARCVF